jgi:hypothetical protein
VRLSGSTFATCALALCSVAALGCGSSARGSRAAEVAPPPENKRIVIEESTDRPAVGLVERSGDPWAAIAVAVAHDLGSQASIALGALVERRISNQSLRGSQSRVHGLGFELHALVQSPEDAARFVRAASQALAKSVGAKDEALAVVRARSSAFRLHRFRDRAEAEVGACSGELGVAGALPGPISAAQLESWRRRVHSANAVAFAAIGNEPILEATSDAVASLGAWPSEDGPNDAWPERDWVGVGPGEGERTLSVALRVADPNRAVHAAQAVGPETSELTARLSALDPAWQLERVLATARPRGACLRLDLQPPKGDPGPRLHEVARAALVAVEESERALRSAKDGTWALDESVLRAADPGHAAAIAAWRTLTGRLEPDSPKRLIHFTTSAEEARAGTSALLERELNRVAARWQKPVLEHRERVEHGQGELWVLLASPCGTLPESESDAGLTATVLRALAERSARSADVEIEPWVTPDGAGLLAHAPRRSPSETARTHSERVASALARALIGARLNGQQVALARTELLAELGPEPDPGYWLAVSALAPRKPSLLEPRGTWPALSEAATLDAEARRHVLVQGPLRLAILANSDENQIETVVQTLERWVRPVQDEAARCPSPTRPPPHPGEIVLEAGSDSGSTSRAYVGVALPTADFTPPREAMLTQLLLNRRGGWLEQALRLPGLVTTARAKLLGGSRSAALLIEVNALEGKTPQAIAQVRGLLERLSQGVVTSNDLELAERALQQSEATLGLDPRRRIVELWRGPRPSATPTLSSLRRFHRSAFRPESHVVVQLKQRH